jgi:hypothetical protein
VSKRIYECGTCGKRDVWGPSWLWFTDGKRPAKLADPEVLFIACSEACARQSPYGDAPLLRDQ